MRYDKRRYKRRNRIEITFRRLKDWRGVAPYDRFPSTFPSARALAAAVLSWLRILSLAVARPCHSFSFGLGHHHAPIDRLVGPIERIRAPGPLALVPNLLRMTSREATEQSAVVIDVYPASSWRYCSRFHKRGSFMLRQRSLQLLPSCLCHVGDRRDGQDLFESASSRSTSSITNAAQRCSATRRCGNRWLRL